MLSHTERLLSQFEKSDFPELRTAFIQRARKESGRKQEARAWLSEQGLEVVQVPEDALLTEDGREILRAQGLAWALREDIHAVRREEALRAAAAPVQSQTPVAQDGVLCSAIIDGQLCGGNLTAVDVCPKCQLGKQGAVQVVSCDVCGHQFAVMVAV